MYCSTDIAAERIVHVHKTSTLPICKLQAGRSVGEHLVLEALPEESAVAGLAHVREDGVVAHHVHRDRVRLPRRAYENACIEHS